MSEIIRVYGYHGTSLKKAAKIIQDGFNVSSNDYDWLGTGVYFFQDAPARAWEWANQQHPTNPAVIRSILRLDEDCIDLLDISWFPLIKNLYQSFSNEYTQSNQPLPRQNPERSKAHRLDCAYFNYIVNILKQEGQNIRSIRSVFLEGERIFPSSAVFDLAHVQIAIIDLSVIEESCIIKP